MENEDTGSFHIYYRMCGSAVTPSPRDHIIKDGEPLCDFGVSVPDDDVLKPISDVSDSEWAVFLGKYSNLCDGCAKALDYYDVVPSDLPESPKYTCPACEETAHSIEFIGGVASITHKSNGTSFRPSSTTHSIPRERYDMWRTNPEEPYSYRKLQKFIENHPHVFRRKEYHRKKRKVYLQETK